MFCSECGAKVSDNAKFCYNCGAKIIGNSYAHDDKPIDEVNEFNQEYIWQIQSKLYESYVDNLEIKTEMFYKKAAFYQMSAKDVDMIYNKTIKDIEKINQYITHLFEENNIPYLSEEQMEEAIQYGEMYSGDREIGEELLQCYFRNNLIKERQESWEVFIDYYGKNGEISVDVLKNSNSKNGGMFFDAYFEILQRLKKCLDKEYENDTLNEEQREKLLYKNIEFKLRPSDMDKIISGYEIETGIYMKKMEARKERVYERVNTLSQEFSLCENSVVIVLGPKYFLIKVIELDFSKIGELLVDETERAKGSTNVLRESILRFEEAYWSTEKKYEDIFEINLSEELTEVQMLIEIVKDSLDDLRQAYNEIDRKEIEKKQARKSAKDERGRWVGGGFGVGGAVKGAVTAGAMNAATGLAYTGANMVGGIISSLVADSARDKNAKDFTEGIRSIVTIIVEMTREAFGQEIENNYPDLYFDPYDMEDTNEEKALRNEVDLIVEMAALEDQDLKREWIESIEETGRSKDVIYEGKNVYQLQAMDIRLFLLASCAENIEKQLLINPWNWRNIISFVKVSEILPITTKEEAEKVMNTFEWEESSKQFIREIKEEIPEVKKQIKKEESVDEKFLFKLKEFVVLLENLTNQNWGKDEVVNLIREIEEVNAYNQNLDKASQMTIEEIISIGHEYCQKKQWDRAKQIYTKALNDNEELNKFLDIYFKSDDKYKSQIDSFLTDITEARIKLAQGDYEKFFFILAKIEDKRGKTIIEYAAEAHNEKLLNILIEKGADVNSLYRLIGKECQDDNLIEDRKVESEYKYCKFCGKKVKESVKFCNFCGNRLQ